MHLKWHAGSAVWPQDSFKSRTQQQSSAATVRVAYLAAVFVRHQEVPSADAASNIQNTLATAHTCVDTSVSGADSACPSRVAQDR